MKILVFIKQVPDTNEIKFDPKTGNLVRDGVESRLNPPDANAIETAMQLKAKHGGTVTAITMGPPQAEAVLKRAKGMGCDDAILLSDRTFGGADTLATAYVLAKAAEKIGDFDLLLFGRHAVDAETAQTGPAVASFLNLPLVIQATAVDVEDGWVYCNRISDDRTEKIRMKLPAAVTVNSEINVPRHPNVMLMMKNKRMETWNSHDLDCDPAQIGAEGSPSYTKRVVEPPKRNMNTIYFEGGAEEIATQFVDFLASKELL